MIFFENIFCVFRISFFSISYAYNLRIWSFQRASSILGFSLFINSLFYLGPCWILPVPPPCLQAQHSFYMFILLGPLYCWGILEFYCTYYFYLIFCLLWYFHPSFQVVFSTIFLSFCRILPSFHLFVFLLATVSLNMFIIILISLSRISPSSLLLDAITARVIIFEGVMLSWFFLFLSLVHWKLCIRYYFFLDLVFFNQLVTWVRMYRMYSSENNSLYQELQVLA